MTLEKALGSGDFGDAVRHALGKLGFKKPDHGRVIAALAKVAEKYREAEKYRKNRDPGARPPTIAAVRDALLQFADNLRNGAALAEPMMGAAWFALLGRYPAPRFAFERYPNKPRPGVCIAYPYEVPPSRYILKGLTMQPGMSTLVVLVDCWKGNPQVLARLFQVLCIDDIENDPLLDELVLSDMECELLKLSADNFGEAQRQELAAIAEWAAMRVQETCAARGNPGPRTVESWANIGTPICTAIGGVLEALWPTNDEGDLPTQFDVSEFSVIVDAVITVGQPEPEEDEYLGRREETESVDRASDKLIRIAVSLRRKLAIQRKKLSPMWQQMTCLTEANQARRQSCHALEVECRSKDPRRRRCAQRALEEARVAISKTSEKINRIDEQYWRISKTVQEIERRLGFGDFEGARYGRRITGRPPHV